jgi:hypothetical protein
MMMNRLIALTMILTAIPNPCFANGKLLFTAKIQAESLAEEAIALLQCLSDRTGAPWELVAAIGDGSHWLRLEQVGSAVQGIYRNGAREEKISLRAGEAATVCTALAPESEAPAPDENLPSLLPLEAEPENEGKSKMGWWWAGGALAVALGGFLLWRANQPAHEAITIR